MKLEWFRIHQKKVFWITAMVVVPSMAFFGAFYKGDLGEEGPRARGPKFTYGTLSGGERAVLPETLIQERRELASFFSLGDFPGSEAIRRRIQYQIGLELGLETGQKELEEQVRRWVLQETHQPEGSAKLYKAYLDNLRLDKAQFERILHEDSVIRKYSGAVMLQTLVTELDLFTQYCQEHQRVRLLYQSFRGQAYEAQAEKPTPNAIEGHYRTYKPKKPHEPGSLYTKASLCVDVLYLPAREVEARIQPTEEELKKFYEIFRDPGWKKDPAKGLEPENTKPLAEVKDDVLKKYKSQKRVEKKNEIVEQIAKDFREEEKKAEREEEKKAEAEKKPFDLAAFARARGLTYWRTQPLTQAEYAKGSEKPEAPDFKAAESFFFDLAHTEEDPEKEQTKAFRRKELQPDRTVGQDPDQGFALMRIPDKGLTPPRLMSLEEATPGLEQRLRTESANSLAFEAAKAARAKWLKGEGIPKPEALLDETFDPQTEHALAREFFALPMAIGEVLPVQVESDPAFSKDPENRRARYLVGFAVEHQLPSYESFEKNFSTATASRQKLVGWFNRYAGRYEPQECLSAFLAGAGLQHLVKLGQPKHDNTPENPLYYDARRGPSPESEPEE